jgi:O-antigen ligase
MFLMLVLLIGVPCAFVEPRRPRNQLFFLTIPVMLLALAFTVTRAGWIGLVVGLLYLGAARFKAVLTVLARAAVIGVLLLVVFGGFASSFLSERSSQERFDIWDANAVQIVEHPFGLGIGATGSTAEKLAELEGEQRDTLQPDNYYLKTALELGVIGLWIFVMLMITSFSCAHTAARKLGPTDAAFAHGVAAMVLAAVVVSASATYFEVFPMDMYFWMLLGVVSACVRDSR